MVLQQHEQQCLVLQKSIKKCHNNVFFYNSSGWLNSAENLIVMLKGPKRDIFGSGVFAQIRPVWIGDLGTRPKNYKF